MAEASEIASKLKHCVLFANFGEAELLKIAGFCSLRSFNRKEVLFCAGDAADAFYFVCSGQVKVFRASAEGKEQILHVASAGQTFAEAVIFLGGDYPASAAALEPTEAVAIHKKGFVAYLRENPERCFRLLAAQAKWMRMLVDKVEDLTLRDAGSRLARWLMELAPEGAAESGEPFEFELPVKKSVLASQLNIASETFSRLLKDFEARELLAPTEKGYRVLNPLEMKRLAGW